MKKTIMLLLAMCLLFALAACGHTEQTGSATSESDTTIANISEAESKNTQATPTNETAANGTDSDGGIRQNGGTEDPSAHSQGDTTASSSNATIPSETENRLTAKAPTTPTEPTKTPSQSAAPKSKKLVVYFSCTGNTKAVAEKIAELCDADLYEITAAQPYTAEDLNYSNNNCRANREMNDENARPAIGSQPIELSGYDTVFIGYPIWWGTMPRIINTFLDTYDLSGKAVMPFCTSGGSGVSHSVSDIKKAESKADVRDGLRVSGANDRDLEKWLSDNDIK